MRGHSCPVPAIRPSVRGVLPLPGLIINGTIVIYGLLPGTGKAFFHP